VIFLQRTFTSLVHAHAGRTQGVQTDKKQLVVFTPFNILTNNFLPLNVALADEHLLNTVTIPHGVVQVTFKKESIKECMILNGMKLKIQ
jgi:hypothetical protein